MGKDENFLLTSFLAKSTATSVHLFREAGTYTQIEANHWEKAQLGLLLFGCSSLSMCSSAFIGDRLFAFSIGFLSSFLHCTLSSIMRQLFASCSAGCSQPVWHHRHQKGRPWGARRRRHNSPPQPHARLRNQTVPFKGTQTTIENKYHFYS